MLTQEDYKKIQQWLTKNSVKDTEFNKATIPLKGNEIITIVQDNQNKKVFLKDLVAQIFNMGVSDFINVSEKYDAYIIDLEEAIRLIPSNARKKGQVITFLNKENLWQIYQFKGALNQWNVLDQWEDLFANVIIDSILPDEEDLTKSLPDENSNSYLSLKDREYNPEDFSGLGRVILRKNIIEIEDPIYGKVKKNVLYQDMINKENTVYEIRYDFDLNGQEITIPKGCILEFDGGSISGGTITGTNTKIIYSSPIFNNINIQGTWLVPIIYDYIFKNIEEVNVARNLVALCNTNIKNNIIIDKTTTCTFDLTSNSKGIIISDNTTLVLNGKIQIQPNSRQSYSVVTLNGNNIQLIGSGSIYGDKPQHTGVEGEWGDGIRVIGENILIDGISVYDCWGDCINLDNAKKIEIKNFLLNNGRRQGISITDADAVNIHNGTISNTGGTDPQYGIDLEPNVDCNVNNIIIDTVIFTSNTRGAIAINGINNDIHNVLINNCYCDLNGENTEEGKDKAVITTYKVFNLEIKNTTIKAPNTRIISIQDCVAVLRNCELSTSVENNYPVFLANNTKVLIDTCTISCIRYCLRTLKNVTIINSSISVPDVTTELFHPDVNTYPQNCYIYNCNIKGAFNNLTPCLNLTLDNNNFDGDITLTSGNNVIIKNNTIKALTITNIGKVNILNNKVLGFIRYTGNSSIEGINISKNILLGEKIILSSVLYLGYVLKAIVKDNIFNCTHDGCAIYATAYDSIIKDNIIKGEQLTYGINTHDIIDSVVESNIIIGNVKYLIKNFGSTSNTYFGDSINMKKFGTFSEKPTPYIKGFQYFNTDTNRVITWNGTTWITSEGNTPALLKGNTTERPSELNSNDIGYQYFDTTLKKPIYYIGDNKWVDATGAEV